MSQMNRAQRLASLVAANIGALINHTVTDPTTQSTSTKQLKLVRLDSEKTAKMKDGSQGAYVILQDLSVEGSEPKLVKMNPTTIDKLFKNNSECGLELVEGIVTPEDVATADAEAQLAAEQDKAARQAESANKKALKDAERKAASAEKKAAKGPTKMDQARTIFDTMSANGAARKDIIAAFKAQLLMSDNGAATYYQTCKNKASAKAE